MYNQNNNQPKPAQSFGSAQESFKFNLAKGFNSGEQFTIIEDLPKTKPLRTEIGEGKSKDGRIFESKTYLIRVVSRGVEADIRIYPKLLPGIAALCPKGLENFKGATFIFDGLNWSFLGIENTTNTQAPISNISHAMRDPRQPDLNPLPPQQDQRDVFVGKLIEGIKAINMIGTDVFGSDVLKMASKIAPGKEVEIVGYAKTKGLIHESDGGVYKVS